MKIIDKHLNSSSDPFSWEEKGQISFVFDVLPFLREVRRELVSELHNLKSCPFLCDLRGFFAIFA
ncbi:MAG: hypothetical protein AB1521_09170 [Bacteroidota bacterium]